MCLSIPGKVIEIEGNMAKASVGGTIVKAGLHLDVNFFYLAFCVIIFSSLMIIDKIDNRQNLFIVG